jgi:predicted metal-dependent phosphoesterase TrpH
MPSKADFHMHSTASDGVLTPTELIDLAANQGVQLLVLSDHDSLEGIEEAQVAVARHEGMKLIPGVELSTDLPGTEVHVLGYFIDPHDARLQERLAQFRADRLDRGRRMVDRLNELGLAITWDRVREIAGDASVGRPHVAQAMLEKGYVQTIEEAFVKWIGRNGPAYADRVKLTPAEAVRFIVEAGGLAVFAHPHYTNDPESILADMLAAGLGGIEVYYRDLEEPQVAELAGMAERHGLIATGGSDYHGLNNPGERLPGDIPFSDEAIDRFIESAKERLGPRATAYL